MAKKVQFGLSNAYYAVVTGVDETTGAYTYDTPKPFGCAVTLSISAVGDQTDYYCDNNKHYTATSNQGYEGSIEVAQITKNFRLEVLGDVEDDNGMIVEYNNTNPKSFALLYEVSGADETDTTLDTRFIYYNCQATRPSSDHNTRTDTTEVDNQSLDFKASPRVDNLVKGYVDSDSAIYDTFMTTVQEPSITPAIQ